MTSRITIGGNVFENCDAALVINGVEVFRLRGRSGDNQLIVDFEIRDENDNLIAKIAKNNVVFVKDNGYSITHGAIKSEVKNLISGEIIASVEEVSSNNITIVGKFHAEGDTVIASLDELILPRNNRVINSTFSGFGKAIEIKNGEISLGVSES